MEQPVQVYVGRWEAQERVFRDLHACQNLDVHYGQKKVAVLEKGWLKKDELDEMLRPENMTDPREIPK